MTMRAWTPKPTRRELAAEVGAVAADLPRFLTAPLYRRHHLTWGATTSGAAFRTDGGTRPDAAATTAAPGEAAFTFATASRITAPTSSAPW